MQPLVTVGETVTAYYSAEICSSAMVDHSGNWKIRVKKGNYEVEVEGPTPERVEKMFDELVKKYMKRIAAP